MQQMNETIVVNRVYSEVKGRKSQEVHNDEVRDTLEVRTFMDLPTASASFRAGIKQNMGNYSSCDVSVTVTVPCYAHDEEISGAIDYARSKVDEALTPALNEFVEILKEKGLVK
jgi:hypothetical protein